MSNIENPQFKLTDYEVTQFICKETNFNQKKPAWKIGNWLVVSYSTNSLYRIYRLDTGKPLITVLFNRPEDAVRTAQIISTTFEDYFSIWENYEDADIFSLAKWSVRNGIEIYEVLKSLPPKIQSMEEVQAIANSKPLKDRVSEWYGRLIRRPN